MMSMASLPSAIELAQKIISVDIHTIPNDMRRTVLARRRFIAIMILLIHFILFALGCATITGIVAAVVICPSGIFPNVSITPCNYHELIMVTKYSQSNWMVNLPGEYYLRVVERDGTPALCILRGSSTPNTSYTLQTINAVGESPLCSPEQRPDCLPSTHVNYNDTDVFGVSVWNQEDSSVHYLIVNEDTEFVLEKKLTNTSFDLQDLWYDALDCESLLVTYIVLESLYVSVLVLSALAIPGLCCVCGKRAQLKKWILYKMCLRCGGDVELIPLDAETPVHSPQCSCSASSAESELSPDIDAEGGQNPQLPETAEDKVHDARPEELEEGTHMTGDHSHKELAAPEGSQPDSTNDLASHEEDGLHL